GQRHVSRAATNIDVREARRRPRQAHLTRPGLTDLDRCPVKNLGTASLPNLNRMRHQGFLNFLLFVTEDPQFHKFIIITMMLPFAHDVNSAGRLSAARTPESWLPRPAGCPPRGSHPAVRTRDAARRLARELDA